MEFNAKKVSVLRYLFLSELDQAVVLKSLAADEQNKLHEEILELNNLGITQEVLRKFDYASLLKALKTETPNDAYQALLRLVERKAASLSKQPPTKLVGAINSMLT